MKPDGMLVEPQHLISAREEVASRGCEDALADLGQVEPVLVSFVGESLAAAAGKLALSGAPTPLVQGIHEEVLNVLLTAVQALRRGHYELWKDTLTGSRLPGLEKPAAPKPRRPRRKGPENNAG
jgi:hypothetical protein